jgi:hypothetical protein
MSVEGPERFTGCCLSGSVRIVASGRPYRVGVLALTSNRRCAKKR